MPGIEEDRRRLSQLSYEAQMLQGQGENVQEQLNALAALVAQLQAAIESLKVLKERNGGADGFVPIGAGVLAPAKINNGAVLVEVGANVLIEKPCDEAINNLEARLKETLEAQEKMQQGALNLGRRLREIDLEAREIIGRMRAAPVEE